MSKQNLYLIFIILILFGVGCSSHPPVLPQVPVKGETNTGFSFSVENVIPVIWWRHGLNKYTDIGLKIGMPVSGTGIDISRVLKKRDRRWEVLNLGYSLSPNSSFDLTYYMFKGSLRDGKASPFNIGWTGFRVMIVPDGSYENPGPGNDQSIRFGPLFGRRLGARWGVELGYFHDFRAGFEDNEDFPHKDGRWATQFSKSTGISMQLFMYLGPTNRKK